MITLRIMPYGDAAVLVQYDYSQESAEKTQLLADSFRADQKWREVVAGYSSVLICFDQMQFTLDEVQKHVEDRIEQIEDASPQARAPGKLVEIAVHYGKENGPDLERISKASGVSESELIKLHSGQIYQVCMMGFIPGFTFLSEAPKALHHPRHETPRLSVPAGSIGIAGWQTGIYGLESPGGWQIIGRTPLKIFDKNREAPFLLQAGDKVKFIPVEGLL